MADPRLSSGRVGPLQPQVKMLSKFQFGVLLVCVLLVFGGGMVMASAQSSGPLPLFLPLVISGGAPPITPTPTKTSIVTLTPIPTATVTPIPTSVPQTVFDYFHPVEDAYVAESSPTSNFGNPHVIWVGSYGGVQRGLVKFDLSSIPVGAHIFSADLDLDYQMRAGSPSPVPTFTITAYRNGATWDELSVTWNSQPAIAEAYGTTTFSTFGTKSFNIKNLVAGWVNGTYPNYGITLGGGANYNNFSVGFCPREGGTWNCDGSYGSPILSVIYDLP